MIYHDRLGYLENGGHLRPLNSYYAGKSIESIFTQLEKLSNATPLLFKFWSHSKVCRQIVRRSSVTEAAYHKHDGDQYPTAWIKVMGFC